MNALKRLGAAFFATSMLCTINFANAKIFVGTSQVAESVNLIDKDLIESQNNELIAGVAKRKKKKKLNKKVVKVKLDGKDFTFAYKPNRKQLEVFVKGMSICIFRGPVVLQRPVLQAKVMSCLDRKVSIRDKKNAIDNVLRKVLN